MTDYSMWQITAIIVGLIVGWGVIVLFFVGLFGDDAEGLGMIIGTLMAGSVACYMFLPGLIWGGFLEISGTASQSESKENSQLVVAFIDGKEVARQMVFFEPDPQHGESQYFSLKFRAPESQFPKRAYQSISLSTLQPYEIKTPFKALALRSFTDIDPIYTSSRLKLDYTGPRDQPPIVRPSGSYTQSIVLALVSVASGLLGYSFLSHFIPTVLPQDKESCQSKVISVLVAALLSAVFAMSLFTSESALALIKSVTSALHQTVTTTIMIVFISVGVFLFLKKIKAYFPW